MLPCAHAMPRVGSLPAPMPGALATPLPGCDDIDGERLPTSLPPVVDAHVHIFPDRLFDALWRWFDEYGWPVRHKLYSPAVIPFLLDRGVQHIVALHYAHRPGMARAMNRYMAEIVAAHPGVVTGTATVLPGEPDAVAILDEGFKSGLTGVKLHCHVQRFAPDHPDVEPIYALCQERGMPLVLHAGREPSSPAYPVPPAEICSVERVAAVLRAFPNLRLCIPHLGADEFDEYMALLDRHEHLYLDTTMMIGDYFAVPDPKKLVSKRPDRILYGTDFPNLPYAWDREMKHLVAMQLAESDLAGIVGGNARRLYGLDGPQAALGSTPSVTD